jgi:NAD(P)-dependent dehydrogenase (short-subunit alcohol dehydrogenase family)
MAPTSMIDAKDMSKSVAANITATATLITYIAPLLGSKGVALFFDDPRAGQPFFGSYGATKAAQIALAQSWQTETAKTGPKVHIVTPDPMLTATRARFFPGEDRKPLAAPETQAKRILSELSI